RNLALWAPWPRSLLRVVLSLLPFREELRIEGIAVARLAAVLLLVEALHLVDHVRLHPLRDPLLVLPVEELEVPLVAGVAFEAERLEIVGHRARPDRSHRTDGGRWLRGGAGRRRRGRAAARAAGRRAGRRRRGHARRRGRDRPARHLRSRSGLASSARSESDG